MRRGGFFVFWAFLVLFFPITAFAGGALFGVVQDEHGQPVDKAKITLRVGDKEYVGVGRAGAAYSTSENGSFYIEMPADAPAGGAIMILAAKSGFKPQSVKVNAASPSDGAPLFAGKLALKRAAGPAFYIATAILMFVYALIIFEWVHRTLAALLGAVAMLLVSYTAGTFNPDYFILSFEDAIHAVDFNVVFLLLGMMIIVGIMRETGVFEWLAYQSFRISKGSVFRLAAILIVVTAVASAFLDNVTTMLLMTPVTIDIALVLGISPVALLMPEILASNIGGTATLIGDPPNIMIGSYAGLTFNDFLIDLTPPIVVMTALLIFMMQRAYRHEYLAAKVADFTALEQRLKKECAIRDSRLLVMSLLVLAVVIFLFFMHGKLHMEPSIAALGGAAFLLLAAKENVVKYLEKDVEWSTLVFFIMLFIIIGGCERAGLIQLVADWVLGIAAGNALAAIMLVLVVSAVTSAVIDNIPYTATMLPVVAYLTGNLPELHGSPILWWALALGACLGGNATIVGASANVVTTGLSEKAGYPISFMYFLKIGLPVTVMSIAVSAVWLLILRG
ncbi:MAG: ArsB/NhaD family transporter [Nitrospinae bacterium]|nr:ArsB/NhaD family transporter [Nitrospinota bacterium]